MCVGSVYCNVCSQYSVKRQYTETGQYTVKNKYLILESRFLFPLINTLFLPGCMEVIFYVIRLGWFGERHKMRIRKMEQTGANGVISGGKTTLT